MNRKQFLAELNQYLTFATGEERQSIISYYDSIFSGTAPEDEAKLILELDTPMKAAISLRRRKDSGEDLRLLNQPAPVEEIPVEEISVEETPVVETPAVEPPAVEAEVENISIVESSETESPVDKIPAAEVPVTDTPEEEPSVVETPAVETPVVEAPVAETPAVEAPVVETPVVETPVAETPVVENFPEDIPGVDVSYEELNYDDIDDEMGKAYEPESKKRPAVTAAYVFKVIGVTLLGIIIAAACLPIAAVGVFLLASMGNLIIAGLSSLYYTTDALLLFGGGLMLGAPGIIVVWLALWIAVKLISKLTGSLKR